ncbi:hypothetical protein [Streptococcus pseudoporcinus]|uniref:Rod shape-determining protein MreD n=2 Tax=Streptococcus pseudoporcinus TaxID=361101 RepID=G5KAS4_9STRE|nr:hypothetical protein [Streptococcus pseudoporcinus]EHI64242.1 hypothetical protein STRPS_2037 [Streptococcus pseudoporcinus LQ 940-04]VEF93153.1 Uncharacterised protein [Streptococcus pseudoporcinus]VTS16219.1 Uncharacterised protein [Streptococcus pseudoporcinus]VUC67863.1 Uncharacterised protein [Streptococcus pseudoporcinus]VUC98789.1 Uncharacterised protein [Streptococcus pseudoporcinus]
MITTLIWATFWLDLAVSLLMYSPIVLLLLKRNIPLYWFWYPPVIFVSIWYFLIIIYDISI